VSNDVAPRLRAHWLTCKSGQNTMNPFVGLGVLLLAIWAVLWLGFHVVSGLIHLLVIVAVVMIVWGLVKRGASAVSNTVS